MQSTRQRHIGSTPPSPLTTPLARMPQKYAEKPAQQLPSPNPEAPCIMVVFLGHSAPARRCRCTSISLWTRPHTDEGCRRA
eukprot:scaffold28674_cov104-Isochrysis_galbana.AAC.4